LNIFVNCLLCWTTPFIGHISYPPDAFWHASWLDVLFLDAGDNWGKNNYIYTTQISDHIFTVLTCKHHVICLQIIRWRREGMSPPTILRKKNPFSFWHSCVYPLNKIYTSSLHCPWLAESLWICLCIVVVSENVLDVNYWLWQTNRPWLAEWLWKYS